MDYLKYLEFEDGSLLVFQPNNAHASIASWIHHKVRSAGLMCATRTSDPTRCGKFFADSSTLSLGSDKALRLDRASWFCGTRRGSPIWSTSEDVLFRLGAKSVSPARLLDVDGYWCVEHSTLSPEGTLAQFLP